jgi:ketosteroid isomerase-like protein
MEKTRLQFRTPDEVETVFYEAFMRCDTDVMAGVWPDDGVVCVHPGSSAITEYDAIVRSWAAIFGHSSGVELKYTVVRRTVADDLAVHVVAEELAGPGADAAEVLATNVYRRFDRGWLMVEHHGSLVQNRNQARTLQ